MKRRSFLAGTLLVATPPGGFAQREQAPGAIIDTHVYAGRWPGRRLAGDDARELAAMLRDRGVAEAWTGSFEALLHKDLGAVNARLVEACAAHRLLSPFGAVNPMLPDWEEDVRRCHEEFRMKGIRLHPGYHAYTLSDPAFLKLLRIAAERNLIVQIAAWMEDERTQHPLLQASIVDLAPLAAAMESAPRARVEVLNGFISVRSVQDVLPRFRKFDRLLFDFAMLEQLMGLRVLTDAVGLERVAFGSYSPMFYFESALLKLRESAFSPAESRALLSGNARRLLEGA